MTIYVNYAPGEVFRAEAHQILRKELELLGGRYVTRAEIFETLDLVACGEVQPMVRDIRPMAETEALHEQLEQGAVTGRAALLIGS
jgi:D-arabinose 1-dehydrogenase-like Zn-dependent alcohol dehydrogenase